MYDASRSVGELVRGWEQFPVGGRAKDVPVQSTGGVG